MPKRISQAELDAVLNVVARFPDGASIEEISAGMESPLPRRTLQRRLAELVKRSYLAIDGRGRGSRYRILAKHTEIQPPIGRLTIKRYAPQAESYLPISDEGRHIKRAVREPIQRRNPVGYDRAFLDEYRPNETVYVPLDIRRRLFELGRSPHSDRPAGTYARQIYNRLLIDLSWNSFGG